MRMRSELEEDAGRLARGLALFVFFYASGWLGWFVVLTGGRFSVWWDYLIGGLSGETGMPLLLQVFALGTAIIATWILRGLQKLNWF